MNFVTTSQVRQLRDGQPPAIVLDVRIPEEYDAAHIGGAQNACAFLMSFVDDVRRLVPSVDTPVIVYGADGNSLESTYASQRLTAGGFRSVHNFAGGLAEWKLDGLPTVGTGGAATPPVLNGSLPLDLTESRVEWTGRNLLNKHVGSLSIKAGMLHFSEGWLQGGEFVVDMASITCADIADPTVNAMLIRHLKSDDFFDVDRHPEARWVILKTAPVPEGRPGLPNLQILGALTVRGVTREIPILAVGGRTPEGRVGIQAVFSFNRTDFGSAYGSGRHFRSLGKHLVNDLVEIQVRLMA